MKKFLLGICPWLIVGTALGYVLALNNISERNRTDNASSLSGESDTLFGTDTGTDEASANIISTQTYATR